MEILYFIRDAGDNSYFWRYKWDESGFTKDIHRADSYPSESVALEELEMIFEHDHFQDSHCRKLEIVKLYSKVGTEK